MAHINLNDVYINDGNNTSSQVGFFNLPNDGDEAIVRFMVDSVEDMEILTVHDIYLNGKFRQISCIRDPRDPIEKCPLCAKEEKIKQVVFIKMIQYIQTPNGFEAKPVVWQRNASTYAFRIKGYLDNYGPLSNILCKIIRHGAKGDMKTTYDIIPNLSPTNFPPENFPVIEDVFKDYSADGRIVLNKTFDEITTFINTGNFPGNEQNFNQSQITPQSVDQHNYNEYTTASPAYINTGVNNQPGSDSQTVEQNFTNGQPMNNMQRPTRYY